MTTPVGSPDGAQRNPGIDAIAGRFPRISLALHAGYWLRPGAVSTIKALKEGLINYDYLTPRREGAKKKLGKITEKIFASLRLCVEN